MSASKIILFETYRPIADTHRRATALSEPLIYCTFMCLYCTMFV